MSSNSKLSRPLFSCARLVSVWRELPFPEPGFCACRHNTNAWESPAWRDKHEQGQAAKGQENARNKALTVSAGCLHAGVWRGGLRGVGEVSLTDLTGKTEQSWNKKAFQLYSGNWGQSLSLKLRQAFNQVFRGFGTGREIWFFCPLLHTTAFLLSREKLLTQETNHLICCRHLPQGKMNNSQKLLSLVVLSFDCWRSPYDSRQGCLHWSDESHTWVTRLLFGWWDAKRGMTTRWMHYRVLCQHIPNKSILRMCHKYLSSEDIIAKNITGNY